MTVKEAMTAVKAGLPVAARFGYDNEDIYGFAYSIVFRRSDCFEGECKYYMNLVQGDDNKDRGCLVECPIEKVRLRGMRE